MFGFFRDRRIRSVIEQVSADLDANLRRLSQVERAATFAMTNAMLMAAAEMWGREVLFSPLSLRKQTLIEVVGALADSHHRLVVDRLSRIEKRNATDVYVLQANRQLRAMELAIATVGNGMVPTARDAAISGWKLLWLSKANSEEAGRALREFERVAQVRCLPPLRKRKLTPPDYAKLARTLPPFLQTNKRTKQAPAPARRRA